MRNIYYTIGVLLLSVSGYCQSKQSRQFWYEIDATNFFETYNNVPGSTISYYSLPEGGAVLKKLVVDSNGQTSFTADSSINPAFLLNGGEQGKFIATPVSPKSFILSDFNISTNQSTKISWNISIEDNENYKMTLLGSIDGKNFDELYNPQASSTFQKYSYEPKDREQYIMYKLQILNKKTRDSYLSDPLLIDRNESAVDIFPTLVRDNIYVHFRHYPRVQVNYSIINNLGITVCADKLSGSNPVVSAIDLPEGTYIINLKYGNRVFTKKIVKL